MSDCFLLKLGSARVELGGKIRRGFLPIARVGDRA
jgi:hypothetical protein